MTDQDSAAVCVCVLPVCPCRGECGRGRVGEVLDVTIRLFLLLVRQLRRETKFSSVDSAGLHVKERVSTRSAMNQTDL